MTGPTIGVCGFGRCGSTAVMTMLDAGGAHPAPGTHPGTFELPTTEHIFTTDLTGATVKLLDVVLRRQLPTPAGGWQFVWIDRNPVDQATSTIKFITEIHRTPVPPGAHALYEAELRRQRPEALARLRALAPVTVLEYERILANPRRAARTLRAVAPHLNVDAATAVVHARTGAVRPDCTVERRLAGVPR